VEYPFKSEFLAKHATDKAQRQFLLHVQYSKIKYLLKKRPFGIGQHVLVRAFLKVEA